MDSSAPSELDENEEIGFVNHTALENRLHATRMIKGLMELDKRKHAKQVKVEMGSH